LGQGKIGWDIRTGLEMEFSVSRSWMHEMELFFIPLKEGNQAFLLQLLPSYLFEEGWGGVCLSCCIVGVVFYEREDECGDRDRMWLQGTGQARELREEL
jgi:hypothetical protein